MRRQHEEGEYFTNRLMRKGQTVRKRDDEQVEMCYKKEPEIEGM